MLMVKIAKSNRLAASQPVCRNFGGLELSGDLLDHPDQDRVSGAGVAKLPLQASFLFQKGLTHLPVLLPELLKHCSN